MRFDIGANVGNAECCVVQRRRRDEAAGAAAAAPIARRVFDFVLLGQRLRMLKRPRASDPQPFTEPATTEQRMMRRLMEPDRQERRGGRMLKPAIRRPA